jgi:hypothetical protein
MRRSSGSRKTAILSDSAHHQLNMYALSAGAAGVGMLLLAQPAEAKIVYTKTHHVIGNHGIYDLDLNHDGTIDFRIVQVGTPTFNGTRASNTLNVYPVSGNAAEGKIRGRRSVFASALRQGAQIGPGKHFGAVTMAATGASDLSDWRTGPWVNVTNRCLGLKFKINGKTHYGWARLSVQMPGNFLMNATLTGYAYETIPGKSIKAGQTFDILPPTPDSLSPDDPGPGASLTNPIPDNSQPASLGLLALGAPGLAIWRREESVDAKP